MVLLSCVLLMSCQDKKGNLEKDDTSETIENVKTSADVDENNVAISEDGVYFWNADGYLMFLDKKSEQVVSLCGLADCQHNSSSCNAYFENIGNQTEGFFRNRVIYYEDALYLIGLDEDEYVSIYKVAKDGSAREKILQLYKIQKMKEEEYSITAPSYYIYDDYVYYIDNGVTKQMLRRKSFKNEKEEVLYEPEQKEANVYRMKVHDGSLYFQTEYYTEETECAKGGIYEYDILENKVGKVKDGAIADYGFQGNILYYATTTGTMKYDMERKKEEVFYTKEEGYPDELSINEKYIYTGDWDCNLTIYNKQGDIEYTGKSEGAILLVFGDGEYIFALGAGEGNNIFMFKTENIGTQDMCWEEL